MCAVAGIADRNSRGVFGLLVPRPWARVTGCARRRGLPTHKCCRNKWSSDIEGGIVYKEGEHRVEVLLICRRGGGGGCVTVR
ncbi:hypothetical protein AKJ16_DCAP08651 [Drosera capensis]